MNKVFSVLSLAAIALIGGMISVRVFAQGMGGMGGMDNMKPAATATAPATTQAALPACCGDSCKKMGAGCCKTDDKGKTTCTMGGSCCVKAETKPADKGMGGM